MDVHDEGGGDCKCRKVISALGVCNAVVNAAFNFNSCTSCTSSRDCSGSDKCLKLRKPLNKCVSCVTKMIKDSAKGCKDKQPTTVNEEGIAT